MQQPHNSVNAQVSCSPYSAGKEQNDLMFTHFLRKTRASPLHSQYKNMKYVTTKHTSVVYRRALHTHVLHDQILELL